VVKWSGFRSAACIPVPPIPPVVVVYLGDKSPLELLLLALMFSPYAFFFIYFSVFLLLNLALIFPTKPSFFPF